MQEADPINPQRVFWELSPRLPDDCIITCDSGSAANWFARDLKLRRGMRASLPAPWPPWGPACPTRSPPSSPTRTAPSSPGRRRRDADERHERADHRRAVLEALGDPRLIVLVLNNQDLNQVTWEHARHGGRPEVRGVAGPAAVQLRALRRVARLEGASASRAPTQVAGAWDEALAADRPVVIDALTDPRCRRCRRTSPGSRPSRCSVARSRAIPTAVTSCARASSRRPRSSSITASERPRPWAAAAHRTARRRRPTRSRPTRRNPTARWLGLDHPGAGRARPAAARAGSATPTPMPPRRG